MFKEIVEVVTKQGDKLKIKFEKTAMCSHCRFTSLCSSQEIITIDDKPDLDLKAGDRIEVGIEESKTFWVSFAIFFIPAIIFIIAVVVFKNWGVIKSFSLGILFMVVYYIIVRIVLKKIHSHLKLKIISKV